MVLLVIANVVIIVMGNHFVRLDFVSYANIELELEH